MIDLPARRNTVEFVQTVERLQSRIFRFPKRSPGILSDRGFPVFVRGSEDD
jgi:hypothetical protein